MSVQALGAGLGARQAARHPGLILGRPLPVLGIPTGAGAIAGADLLLGVPFYPLYRAAPKEIRMRTTAGGAGSAVKVGIWLGAIIGDRVRAAGTPLAAQNTGVATTAAAEITVPISNCPILDPELLHWIFWRATGTMPTVVAPGAAQSAIAQLMHELPLGTAITGASVAVTGGAYADNIAAVDLTPSGTVVWSNATGSVLPLPSLVY